MHTASLGAPPWWTACCPVRYALYSEYIPNTDLVNYIQESGGTYLYENLYTLPLGFVLPYDLADNWQYQMENPAEVQNDLCLLLGTDDVLVPVETEVSGSGCTFTADMAGEYYVYIQNKKVKNVKASLPSGEKNFSNVDRGYLLEMGNLSEGSRITLTPGESGETLTAAVYRFSPRAMIQVYDRLSQSPLHLDSWEGHEAYRNGNCCGIRYFVPFHPL